MALPSQAQLKEAKAVSKLAQLRKGTLVRKPAKWPGTELSLLFQALSCSEVQECQAEAIIRFGELKIPLDAGGVVRPSLIALFEDEVMTQLLFRACRDPEKPDDLTFAESIKDLRDNTTVDQRAEAFQRYCEFADQIDPAPEKMSAEVVEEILDLLKKKDATRLLALGSRMLVSFMLTSADRLTSLPTGRSESSDISLQ